MSTFVSVFVMVKILNKCILSILVSILLFDRQRSSLHTPQSFHTPLYWLSSWSINKQIQEEIGLADWAKQIGLTLRIYGLYSAFKQPKEYTLINVFNRGNLLIYIHIFWTNTSVEYLLHRQNMSGRLCFCFLYCKIILQRSGYFCQTTTAH